MIDSDRITVRYVKVANLMHDLKAFGMSNMMTNQGLPLTRTILEATQSHYQNNFSDKDGRLRASFDMISVSGWVPDPSQQKPLKPGSAKHNLAQALKQFEK